MSKMGAPLKYKVDMCALVIAAGEDGDTLAGMADACGIHRETLNEWAKQYPDFSDAIKAGLQKAQVWWERQGRKATFGGCDGFSATSYIFQMKNRFKDDWRDKPTEGEEQTTVNVFINKLSDG